MKNRITSYCRIKNHSIHLNGELAFSTVNANFTTFSKEAHQHFKINYLKFFKMDNLSKLAFLGAELIFQDKKLIDNYAPEEIAVCFCSSASSLDTDRKHADSIRDRANYFPSPSVFVYTLPNIMLGEICIRNNFKGENACFIQEVFEPEFSSNLVASWMDETKCKACLLGYIDFEFEKEDALLCWIEKSSNTNFPELTIENYKNLYLNN